MTGCHKAKLVTDAQFKEIQASPRVDERFHYAGSKNECDYFVGEQWNQNSFPSKAEATEIYYKIKSSSLIKNRFALTEDVTKWVTIEP